MANLTPYWDPADAITCHAETDVVGGKLVAVSGPAVGGNPQVGHAGGSTPGLTTTVVGIATHDAAAGTKVTVARVGVWPLLAAANLSAGALVTAGTSGNAGSAVAATAGFFHAYYLDDVANGALGMAVICPNSSIDTTS